MLALLDRVGGRPTGSHRDDVSQGRPAPRGFWARRQAHETTIHGVDVLAAPLGPLPTVEEPVSPTRARGRRDRRAAPGFFTRGRSRLSTATSGHRRAPTDTDQGWIGSSGAADGRASGRQLSATLRRRSLARRPPSISTLWNRGDEAEASGHPTCSIGGASPTASAGDIRSGRDKSSGSHRPSRTMTSCRTAPLDPQRRHARRLDRHDVRGQDTERLPTPSWLPPKPAATPA